MASWKWMVIGLAMTTIFAMWADGSIQSVHGFAVIFGTYLAVWTAHREINDKRRPTQA